MKANRSTGQPRRATAAICLTSVSSSAASLDEVLPRFVRATQILMLGQERRRAAEAHMNGKGAGR